MSTLTTPPSCGFKPFMEYAGSYALFNYRLEDPSRGLEYDNLRLIRAFEHGLDPTSSEAGFVLVHIDMVRNSGPLVAGTMACLSSLSSPSSSSPSPEEAAQKHHHQRESFNAGLRQILEALRRVNGVMEGMWAKSKPRSYTSFRTFIFGITSQSMFPPEGVVYEGVNGDRPMNFRGESGANDSMVPLSKLEAENFRRSFFPSLHKYIYIFGLCLAFGDMERRGAVDIIHQSLRFLCLDELRRKRRRRRIC